MPTKTGSLLRHQSSINNHETQHVGLCDSTHTDAVTNTDQLTVAHRLSHMIAAPIFSTTLSYLYAFNVRVKFQIS